MQINEQVAYSDTEKLVFCTTPAITEFQKPFMGWTIHDAKSAIQGSAYREYGIPLGTPHSKMVEDFRLWRHDCARTVMCSFHDDFYCFSCRIFQVIPGHGHGYAGITGFPLGKSFHKSGMEIGCTTLRRISIRLAQDQAQLREDWVSARTDP